MYGWMYGWNNGCVDGWMRGRMHGCVDSWMDACVHAEDGCMHTCMPLNQYSIHPSQMPNITVSRNGILKLLKDLNPPKAAGPNQLEPLINQML